MNFDLYTIEYNAPHLKAFQKIEENRKCFLIVLKDEKVVGTFTDGDVRRAFLKGVLVSDSIEKTYNKNFEYLEENHGVIDAIKQFQRGHIKFLPVLDKQGKLKNIVTKENLDWISMQGKMVSIDYDFMSIDDLYSVREIHIRPWGFYKTTVINELFQSKVINVKPLGALSLQKHMRREEYWIIVHGTGQIQIGDSIKTVSGGEMLFIPKNCLHQMKNLSDTDALIVVEVQLGDYFGEDDIIRYADVYGRA